MADQATPPPDPDEIVDAQVVADEDLAAAPDDRPLPAAAPAQRPELPPLPAANVGGAGPPGVVTLYGTTNPKEIVAMVSDIATALADVIKQQGLAKNLGGKKDHVEIEGWQTAGTLLGLQAMTVWTGRVYPIARYKVRTKRKKWGWVNGKREITEETTDEWVNEGWSYEAIAEVRTLDGRIVGRGEAICSRREANWFDAEDSAVKGMAQTRAQSRAFKQALGFIVGLAGYSSTPKEEMDAAGVEAPGPTGEGPPFGRALKDNDKRAFLQMLTRLLLHGDNVPGAQEAALRVIAKLKAEAGEYTPYIAAYGLMIAAQEWIATDPAKRKADAEAQQKAKEDAEHEAAQKASKAEADQAHADAEAPQDLPPADPPPPAPPSDEPPDLAKAADDFAEALRGENI